MPSPKKVYYPRPETIERARKYIDLLRGDTATGRQPQSVTAIAQEEGVRAEAVSLVLKKVGVRVTDIRPPLNRRHPIPRARCKNCRKVTSFPVRPDGNPRWCSEQKCRVAYRKWLLKHNDRYHDAVKFDLRKRYWSARGVDLTTPTTTTPTQKCSVCDAELKTFRPDVEYRVCMKRECRRERQRTKHREYYANKLERAALIKELVTREVPHA